MQIIRWWKRRATGPIDCVGNLRYFLRRILRRNDHNEKKDTSNAFVFVPPSSPWERDDKSPQRTSCSFVRLLHWYYSLFFGCCCSRWQDRQGMLQSSNRLGEKWLLCLFVVASSRPDICLEKIARRRNPKRDPRFMERCLLNPWKVDDVPYCTVLYVPPTTKQQLCSST